MTRSRVYGALVPVVLLLAILAPPISGATEERQSQRSAPVTVADIQRLQDAVYDAGVDLRRVRGQDADRVERLQVRLDDLRDEAIYLKVKQRKEGVSRSEYNALRDAIEDFRAEVRGPSPAALPDRRPTALPDLTDDSRPARQGTTTRPDEIPADTQIDVRLEQAVSSETAQVEDQVTATTVADLYSGTRLVIPAESSVRGLVTAVTKAGRLERTGKLTLAFDRVTANGRSYAMRGTVVGALESGGYRQDAGKIAAGAGVGAIIGGILGGVKGALAGVLIGGGGVVVATEGQDVRLPAGTVLRLRLDSPLTVR